MENGFIEIFNRWIRDELLNTKLFSLSRFPRNVELLGG